MTTPAEAERRRELLRARDVLRKMRFSPVVWERGGVSVEETFQKAPMFEVTHNETFVSIRTTADGLGSAIARLRRQAAEERAREDGRRR